MTNQKKPRQSAVPRNAPIKPFFFHHKEYLHTGNNNMPNGSKVLARVVTGAYYINMTTGVLTYGATLYKKESKQDNWNRKLCVTRAATRFYNCPVVINLKEPEDQNKPWGPAPQFYNYRRLEKFLLSCFTKYGMQENSEKGLKGVIQFPSTVFYKIFNPQMTDEEAEKLEQRQASDVETSSGSVDDLQADNDEADLDELLDRLVTLKASKSEMMYDFLYNCLMVLVAFYLAASFLSIVRIEYSFLPMQTRMHMHNSISWPSASNAPWTYEHAGSVPYPGYAYGSDRDW